MMTDLRGLNDIQSSIEQVVDNRDFSNCFGQTPIRYVFDGRTVRASAETQLMNLGARGSLFELRIATEGPIFLSWTEHAMLAHIFQRLYRDAVYMVRCMLERPTEYEHACFETAQCHPSMPGAQSMAGIMAWSDDVVHLSVEVRFPPSHEEQELGAAGWSLRLHVRHEPMYERGGYCMLLPLGLEGASWRYVAKQGKPLPWDAWKLEIFFRGMRAKLAQPPKKRARPFKRTRHGKFLLDSKVRGMVRSSLHALLHCNQRAVLARCSVERFLGIDASHSSFLRDFLDHRTSPLVKFFVNEDEDMGPGDMERFQRMMRTNTYAKYLQFYEEQY